MDLKPVWTLSKDFTQKSIDELVSGCQEAERQRDRLSEALRKIAALGTNRRDIISAKNYARKALAELEKP